MLSVSRLRQYVVVIRDPDGFTRPYAVSATSRRRAEANARAWTAESDVTLVEIYPAHPAGGHRLLAVAGVAFAVGATTIAAMMLVGLRLEGAL